MYYVVYAITTILFSIVVSLFSNFFAALFGYKESGVFSIVATLSMLVVYGCIIHIFHSVEVLLYFAVGSIIILWMVLGYDKSRHRN